jgi:pimeloyl-ACP methyl ester carboxylesterase
MMMALTMMLGASEVWASTPLPGAMPEPVEHGQTKVNGVTLAWAVYGAGDPVILLHGGAGNSSHWAFQVPSFAAGHRVYVIDARGHGHSTRTDAPASYAQMADDVVALMDTWKLDHAAIVGWSDGGIVGLELAIRFPSRVTKLVAYAANSNQSGLKKGGGAAFDAYFARCAKDFPGDWKALLAWLRPMWRTQPNYTDAQLASITAPTLVIDGAHDELIREDHQRAIAKAIPNATLVFIPDASHFALFQQPEAFTSAVLAFLRPAR